jgi:hypothetical protein
MEKKILALIALGLLLFFLSYKFRSRKSLSNLLMAGASVLVTLLFIELVYRKLIKKKDATDHMHPFSLYVPDSLLGYKNNQPALYKVVNSFPNGDTVYNTSYTILDDTSRSGVHFNFRRGYKSNNNNKEVVFLGCSLTFGQGLDDTQSLPYRYGAAADISTVNMACIGYGIHQVYQLFNDKFSHLNNHNRTFIYPFFYDHILRANGIYGWNNAGPYFEVQHDTLVNLGPLYRFKHLKGDDWSHYASLFGSFKVIKDNVHQVAYRAAAKNLSDMDYQRCFIMLQEMAKKINNSGGRFIIVNWAGYNWFYKPVSDISKTKIDQQFNILSKSGVQVIPVASIIDMKDQKNFIPADGHPSAFANQTIANWLAKHLHQFVNR